MKGLRIAVLACVVAASPVSASAQPLITFDDWVLGCDDVSPCSNGYFDGDLASFWLTPDLGGVPCRSGQCVKVDWLVSGADDSFPHIRPEPLMTAPTSLWAQASFYIPDDIMDRLDRGSRLRLTLLQINTDTDDHFARILIDSDSGGLRTGGAFGGMSIGGSVLSPLSRGWHEVGLGFDFPPVGTSGPVVVSAHLDGDSAADSVEMSNPGVSIAGGWGLGFGRYDDTPPWLAIDDLCFATDRTAAGTACARAPMADAGVPDAGDAMIRRDTGVAVSDSSYVEDGTSFRGVGGCACDTATRSAGDDALPYLALVFWLASRRRRR